MDLRVKRAEILDKLTRMQQSAEKDGGMSSSVSKEFTSMLDQVDSMTNEIRLKELIQRGNQNPAESDDFQPSSAFYKNAAKRTLHDAYKMLARGERQKIDSGLMQELADKNGLKEDRTTYASGDIIQTNLNSVFMEMVKDDRFLSRIPKVVVNEGYLKYPVITREGIPTAEGKADADALSGSDTTFTSITLQPKNSYVLSRFHKDLIRDGGSRAMDSIWASCRQSIAKRLVQGVLYGSGSNAGEFNGLDNVSGANTYDTSGGSILDYSLVTRGAKALNDKFVDHSEMIGLISTNTYQKFSDLRELSSSGAYLQLPSQIANIPLIANAQIKTNYGAGTNRTKLYMMNPSSSIMALFGNFELELNERYAEFDHAAAMIVFRSDFAFLDPEHLFVATNLPT